MGRSVSLVERFRILGPSLAESVAVLVSMITDVTAFLSLSSFTYLTAADMMLTPTP